MFYYKYIDADGNITYQSRDKAMQTDGLIPITEQEYNSIIEYYQQQAEAEYIQAEQTKDERIIELEQENAALLYQILTGEEFTDV